MRRLWRCRRIATGEEETVSPSTPGPFVAALEYASGKVATVIGKPEKAFFEAAPGRFGLEAPRMATVGDGAEANVAGARAAGLLGVRVETGKYRPGEAGLADLVVGSFADLLEAIGPQDRSRRLRRRCAGDPRWPEPRQDAASIMILGRRGEVGQTAPVYASAGP